MSRISGTRKMKEFLHIREIRVEKRKKEEKTEKKEKKERKKERKDRKEREERKKQTDGKTLLLTTYQKKIISDIAYPTQTVFIFDENFVTNTNNFFQVSSISKNLTSLNSNVVTHGKI